MSTRGYRGERSRARRQHRRQRSPSASDTSYASGVSESEYSERGGSYSDDPRDVQSDGQSDGLSDSLQAIDASPDNDDGEGTSVNNMHMHPLNFSCKIMFTIKKKKNVAHA